SDDDWRAIKALKLNLPDETRLEINRWLDVEASMRRRQRLFQKPAATRRKLERLHAMVSKLSRELAEIDDRTGRMLISPATGPTALGAADHNWRWNFDIPPDAGLLSDLLEKTHIALFLERKAQILNMSHWLKDAAEKINPGKRGPDGMLY